MKETVARPDVLAYEQGRQAGRNERLPVLAIEGGYWKESHLKMLIQQARQETAREIIAEVKEHYNWIADEVFWQSLENKHLKVKK